MIDRKLIKTTVTTIFLFFTTGINAAIIDLTGAGSSGGGFGNSLQFSNDAISVSLKAYGETGNEHPHGSLFYLFESAEVYSWNSGIGVCNQQEGIAAGGCSSNEHEVDTVNRDDLLVFEFDQTVNFESLTVDPFNGPGSDPNDRDIIYWVGYMASLQSLTTETFNTLSSLAGFSNETLSSVSSSYSPFTHSLYGTGNILLVSGDYHNLGCKNKNTSKGTECEAYKISDITVSAVVAPVPVPAAIWLFGTALLALRFKKK